jgi:hypothetical protein
MGRGCTIMNWPVSAIVESKDAAPTARKKPSSASTMSTGRNPAMFSRTSSTLNAEAQRCDAPRPQLDWNRSCRQNQHNDRPFQGDPLCGARTVPIHGDPKFATRTCQDYNAPPNVTAMIGGALDSEDDYQRPLPRRCSAAPRSPSPGRVGQDESQLVERQVRWRSRGRRLLHWVMSAVLAMPAICSLRPRYSP